MIEPTNSLFIPKRSCIIAGPVRSGKFHALVHLIAGCRDAESRVLVIAGHSELRSLDQYMPLASNESRIVIPVTEVNANAEPVFELRAKDYDVVVLVTDSVRISEDLIHTYSKVHPTVQEFIHSLCDDLAQSPHVFVSCHLSVDEIEHPSSR